MPKSSKMNRYSLGFKYVTVIEVSAGLAQHLELFLESFTKFLRA
jgi:hypothetical protein